LLRAVPFEEFLVPLDVRLDEIFRCLLENRMPFFGVRLQQCIAPPTFKSCGKLPAEIGYVIEPIVEAVSAVRGVGVGGVAGDKDAAHLICFGDGDAQIPEPHIIEVAAERETGDLLQQTVKVVVISRRVRRDRSVKEPLLADIDPSEELPITL